MLIFPPAMSGRWLAHRRALNFMYGAAGLLAVAVAVWALSAERLRQTPEVLAETSEASGPTVNSASAAPLSQSDATPAEVFGFLAEQARELGIDWVSLAITETASGDKSASPLESWQAKVNLAGGYREVKRWLKEATGRYPKLVVTHGRWNRVGLTAALSQATPAASGERLEVQFQMSWLKLPTRTGGTEASPAGFSEP